MASTVVLIIGIVITIVIALCMFFYVYLTRKEIKERNSDSFFSSKDFKDVYGISDGEASDVDNAVYVMKPEELGL